MFVDWFDAAAGVRPGRPMWEEMNALLQALERPAPQAASPLRVETDGDALRLELDAPGARPEDVRVSVTGRRLEFSLVREPRAPEGFQTVRQERRSWRVERTFELPFDVDASSATASLDAGVFRLTLPRLPAATPIEIPVRVGLEPAPAALTANEEV